MNDQQISTETIIKRSDALLSNKLGEDVVMMDIEQGEYYGMEAVAARIWELTENPVSINSLCETLTGEYEVSPEQCKQEISTFLDDLLKRKIVEVVG